MKQEFTYAKKSVPRAVAIFSFSFGSWGWENQPFIFHSEELIITRQSTIMLRRKKSISPSFNFLSLIASSSFQLFFFPNDYAAVHYSRVCAVITGNEICPSEKPVVEILFLHSADIQSSQLYLFIHHHPIWSLIDYRMHIFHTPMTMLKVFVRSSGHGLMSFHSFLWPRVIFGRSMTVRCDL